jgi:hypothetical protein
MNEALINDFSHQRFIDPERSSRSNASQAGDGVVGEGITKTKPELIGISKL